jgi:hypothetical protein
MERPSRKPGVIQRPEAGRLGDRRRVKNDRPSGNAPVKGCSDYLVDSFVELRITHADEDHVRARKLFRQRTRRCRDPGRTPAVKANDVYP